VLLNVDRRLPAQQCDSHDDHHGDQRHRPGRTPPQWPRDHRGAADGDHERSNMCNPFVVRCRPWRNRKSSLSATCGDGSRAAVESQHLAGASSQAHSQRGYGQSWSPSTSGRPGWSPPATSMLSPVSSVFWTVAVSCDVVPFCSPSRLPPLNADALQVKEEPAVDILPVVLGGTGRGAPRERDVAVLRCPPSADRPSPPPPIARSSQPPHRRRRPPPPPPPAAATLLAAVLKTLVRGCRPRSRPRR